MVDQKTFIKETLKKEIIEEFRKKGLEELILLFIAEYPDYPYHELQTEKIYPEYLSYYDIDFLTSYMRYSDLSLLELGIRDADIKEKIFFLHTHIGTIFPSYRNFILSDISLEDIKRWLPLLSVYPYKEQILKCTITSEIQIFLDHTSENSYEKKNLELLGQYYPNHTFDLEQLAKEPNQQQLYQYLKQIEEIPSFSVLIERFSDLKSALDNIPLEEQSSVIQTYLRNASFYSKTIHSYDDYLSWYKEVKEKEMFFLEQEYDLTRLKSFYTSIFLGMNYNEFLVRFDGELNVNEQEYLLLKQLVDAKFPLSLKQDFYNEISQFQNLRSYLKKCEKPVLNDIEMQNSLAHVQQEQISSLQGMKFMFQTVSLKDYESAIRHQKEYLTVRIQTDTSFHYQPDYLIISAPFITFDGKNYGEVRCSDIKLISIMVYDDIQFLHVSLKKRWGLPLTIVDTEDYVEKNMRLLEQLLEKRNIKEYLVQKRALFEAIKDHPWLLAKYFCHERLFHDSKYLSICLERWLSEQLPNSFLKQQLEVLTSILSFDEQLEKEIKKIPLKPEENYRETIDFYQKLV